MGTGKLVRGVVAFVVLSVVMLGAMLARAARGAR
jgi:hypothetical protein